MDQQFIKVTCVKCGKTEEIPSEKGGDGKLYIHVGSNYRLKMREYFYILCEECMKIKVNRWL